ncbi:MAG: nuclear transport factor 2 family protein [Pseudomonadota bacterium]
MTNRLGDLCDAAQTYMMALHEGDTAQLGEIFLPEAHLYASIDNEFRCMPIADYLELVGSRESPASQGHSLSGELISIDTSGPASAVAKVAVAVPPTRFVDLLSFLHVEGRWRIITKVYHIAD